MEKQKHLKQLKLTRETKIQYKRIAIDHDKTLHTLYNEAIQWFTSHRNEQTSCRYYACPIEGKITSIWISKSNVETMRIIAARDGVAENRVLYTALHHYLDKLLTAI